eukprot:scaffold5159_cov112-Cylindrotheca_fusiformis.AAC.22
MKSFRDESNQILVTTDSSRYSMLHRSRPMSIQEVSHGKSAVYRAVLAILRLRSFFRKAKRTITNLLTIPDCLHCSQIRSSLKSAEKGQETSWNSTMNALLVTSVIAGASVLLFRRRISKKWIDYRSVEHDLTDKVIVITGGNTGLGYEAATDFARRNATVLIACRTMEKGKEAAKNISEATGNSKVDCMELDLASMTSVREFIKSLKSNSKYSSIDALVCNAGIWLPPDDIETDPQKHKTKDGFEVHFGVNHLSHFLLANSLIDLLEKSGDGRVIFVSSSLMKSGKINFDAYDHIYNSRKPDGSKEKKSFAPPAYCDTKLMNALTCRYFSTILPTTVTAYSVCPGFCRSELARNVSFAFPLKLLLTPLMLMIQRTTQQGAQNIVFVTLEDKKNLKSGEMYKDGEIGKEEADYIDSLGSGLAKKLWDVSSKLASENEK